MPFAKLTRRQIFLSLRLALSAAFLIPCQPPASGDSPPVHASFTSVQLPANDLDVTAQAFSPDGGVFAIGMADGTAALYDRKTHRWGARLRGLLPGPVQDMALSPYGRRIAVCGESSSDVVVADVRTGAVLRRLPAGERVTCLAVSSDGRWLAAGTVVQYDKPNYHGKALIWSLSGFALKQTLRMQGPVDDIDFSLSGDRLLVSGNDLLISALPSGKTIRLLPGAGSQSASISPDGKAVFCDRGLRSVRSGRPLAAAFGDRNLFTDFSQTGSIAVAYSHDRGTTYVLDGHTGRLLSPLDIYESPCALSPDGKTLAAAGRDDRAYFYRIDEGALRRISNARAHPTKQSIQARLETAIERGDKAQVKVALADGADPNLARGENPVLWAQSVDLPFTPLARAAYDGRPAVFALLVAAGARFDPGDPASARQIFLNALQSRRTPMVRWLLDHGMSLALFDDLPLVSFAAERGDIPTVTLLLDRGAPVDARADPSGPTALMAAARSGKADVVRLLLAHGADPALRGAVTLTDDASTATSALGFALAGGDPATVTLLLGAVPDLNAGGFFADNFAVVLRSKRGADLLRLLLNKGADPNTAGDGGATPLIDAARSGSRNCVALLLAHGADVHATDETGATALDVSQDGQVKKLLLAAGAKPSEP